jgi:hypothetical protein
MLSNEAYETLRAVRVELSMYPFEKDRPEDD